MSTRTAFGRWTQKESEMLKGLVFGVVISTPLYFWFTYLLACAGL